jgi:serine/threonine-protein kinase RsbW
MTAGDLRNIAAVPGQRPMTTPQAAGAPVLSLASHRQASGHPGQWLAVSMTALAVLAVAAAAVSYSAQYRMVYTAKGVAPVAAVQFRRLFPGEECQLRVVRRWLAASLPGCPILDELVSIATELGSNAIKHSATGLDGKFAVEVTHAASGVQVAVTDDGGPGEPQVMADADGEHGRGLVLVRGLSTRMGAGGGPGGRTVWARIDLDAHEH